MMSPPSAYWGWIETFEVWMSLAATPPCLSTAVTAEALESSSTSDALALGSVTSMSTDTVRRFGVAEAIPVPCTVSLGAEPAHDAAAEGGDAVAFDAASPSAAPPTANAAVMPMTPARRAVLCSMVSPSPGGRRASDGCAQRHRHRFRRTGGPEGSRPRREHRH